MTKTTTTQNIKRDKPLAEMTALERYHHRKERKMMREHVREKGDAVKRKEKERKQRQPQEGDGGEGRDGKEEEEDDNDEAVILMALMSRRRMVLPLPRQR